jgi:hypothetical protein
VFRLVKELRATKFAGAVFVTSRGEHGFEEGSLLLDAGVPVACGYEYHAFSKKFFGRDAFSRFANACAAGAGVVEVFQCSPDEIHSLLSENHALLCSPRDAELVKPLKYSSVYEDEVYAPHAQKQSLFKKMSFKGF